MTGIPGDSLKDLSGTMQISWHRFLDVYEPLRPELYRYCRYLSRSPWDAEDLSQDALARAFAMLGRMGEPPPNPRAWLFRVASNLWIDQTRRGREPPPTPETDAIAPEPREPREAAATLLVRLSPQERAAVVLKDVFDFTLDEIAEALSTTAGAVKAALSRGRGKLVEPDQETDLRAPAPGVLDAFCDAFNARDLERLTALLLDTATIDVVGGHTEYRSPGVPTRVLHGMMYGSQRLADPDKLGGLDARFFEGILPTSPRCEVRIHRGEPLLLSWYAHEDGEAVRAVTRAETSGDRIVRLRNYFYTPDFLAEICRELDVPFRINGYRFWQPGR